MKVRKLLSVMGVFTACALASCTEGETELNNAGTETTPVVSDTNTSNVETTTENNGGSSTTTTEESTGGASTTTTEESKGGSSTTTTTTQQNQNLGTYYANVNTTLKDELFRKNLSQVISVGFVHRTIAHLYILVHLLKKMTTQIKLDSIENTFGLNLMVSLTKVVNHIQMFTI